MIYESFDPFEGKTTNTACRQFTYRPSSMSWLTKCQDEMSLRQYATEIIDKHYGFAIDSTYAFRVRTVDAGLASGYLEIQVKMHLWEYEEYCQTKETLS